MAGEVSQPNRKQSFFRTPILGLIVINLAIGLVVLRAYGDSWDEFKFYKYAKLTLNSLYWLRAGELPTFGDTYDNYGPVYVAGIMVITQSLEKLGFELPVSQVRHYLVFMTFQLGVYSFYQLSRRWMGAWAAGGASFLFSTQPLFWGHAFISPKDIPFMSLFLASVYLGLRMVDKVFGDRWGDSGVFDSVAKFWQELSQNAKRNFLIVTAAWFTCLGILILGTELFHTAFSNLINSFYTTERQSVLGEIFIFVAEDAFTAEAEIYIHKAFVFFQQLRFFLLVLSPIPLIGYYWRKFKPVLGLFAPAVILAGVFLGLTVSVRILGPLAGVLVALYIFPRVGKKSIPILLIYAASAIYVLYLTWPYLWPEPYGHLLESVRVMSQYPWLGKVLFNGTYYPSTALPWTYLPVVLAIQMTEPVWILLLLGVMAFLGIGNRNREHKTLFGLSLVWFLLPVIGLIVLGSPLYDNSRQIFFLLPPIFLLAGLGLEWIFQKVKQPIFKIMIIIGIAIPGIISGIRLHPYEYIYYNRFVGGVAGAERRFELDYWGLSYFEAAAYLNQVAPPNARVWVAGPAHLLPVREDIFIYSLDDEFRAETYDYVVAMTRYDLDLITFPKAEIIHTISRDGAILSVIKGSTQP